MLKKEFPQIHYYDQDFVDIYDRSWAWVSDFWRKADSAIGINNPFYAYSEGNYLSLYESCIASFFLVYFNKKYPVHLMLDNFYGLQEESGAIRGEYDLETGKPILTKENPDHCPVTCEGLVGGPDNAGAVVSTEKYPQSVHPPHNNPPVVHDITRARQR